MKAKARRSSNRIYQIYFRAEQKAGLAAEFIPYFKPEEEEKEWREYWTFQKNSRDAIASKGLTGFVSWKFESKSGVSPKKFLKFIENNPGYDLYFLNPFPLDALLFDSVWRHGEQYHPRLTDFSAMLLLKTGHRIDLDAFRNSPEQAGFSNYWVGNAKFWRAYMDFTLPVAKYIRNKLTDAEAHYVYSIADKVSNCSHIPFIFERLFTTLLVANSTIKYLSYQYDDQDLKKRYSFFGRLLVRILRHDKFRQSLPGKFFCSAIVAARRLREKLR
ncbi:MAG: hypothetical protein ACOY5B_13505 [Spirochaetota bacterium]